MLSSRGLGVWSRAEARAMRWTAAIDTFTTAQVSLRGEGSSRAGAKTTRNPQGEVAGSLRDLAAAVDAIMAAFQIWSGLGRRLGHWPAGVPVTMISDSVMQNQSHARLRMEGPKQLCRSDIINGSLVI
jgi:hypothetical protein